MAAAEKHSVAVVLGTRPEAIKLAGIASLLGDAVWVIHTGQHYDAELGSDILEDLRFPRPHDVLDIGGTSRAQQVGKAVSALDELFVARRPSTVIVQGDTNSTLAGALAANAAEIPLIHVEAGLRSHDRAMPEEHNRVIADHVADLCCAPTPETAANLAAEGIGRERVAITGNPVVEAVLHLLPDEATRKATLHDFGLERNEFAVATLHRPENVDDPAILRVILAELASLHLPVVLPLHPRTGARIEQFGMRSALDGITIVPPLTPRTFLTLEAESAFWVSDSGGLQEEASILKRPVIVVRRSTERPEVQGTFATLVSPGERIGEIAREWCEDIDGIHRRLADIPSPYGDGTASQQIVDLVKPYL